jgi:hypothetical protein
MSEWISVEERLPEWGLVIAHGIRANGESTIQIVCTPWRGEWDMEDQGFMEKPRVTHWMPIPEPPQVLPEITLKP